MVGAEGQALAAVEGQAFLICLYVVYRMSYVTEYGKQLILQSGNVLGTWTQHLRCLEYIVKSEVFYHIGLVV